VPETHQINGKHILITGASSGIGKAAAIRLANLGAIVILVARREDLLIELSEQICKSGSKAHYYAVDLTVTDEIDKLTEKVLEEFGTIDILINNAGRSIRRPITESLDRFHDFGRCMDINYFAAVRLIRNLLPAMKASGEGHIINSSTWGTQLPAGGFGPYNASKIALDCISNTLRMEMRDKGICVTQIHFPLVHTAMSGATESFKKLPGMSTEQASDWIIKAIEKKPREVLDLKTRVARWLYFMFPNFVEKVSMSSPFSIK
jgi:short-subunit dehydrogenase